VTSSCARLGFDCGAKVVESQPHDHVIKSITGRLIGKIAFLA